MEWGEKIQIILNEKTLTKMSQFEIVSEVVEYCYRLIKLHRRSEDRAETLTVD